MKTVEAVVEALEALSVEYVFGYPGGRVIELFEALADSPIEVIRPRDERQASVMAELYGRRTGKPGVLAGQGPWIASIGAIGQMEARLGSSPMVVLTEASERGEYAQLAPYQQASGEYGGLDIGSVLEGITTEQWQPGTPAETVRAVQLAFKHARAGRPGPTAVVFDGDAITAEYPSNPTPPVWEARAQARTWHAGPAIDDLEQAGAELAAADRPVIVAGNGVHAADAYEELLAVAETFDAVVTTSYLGKSTIAENHERAAGVIGSFGHEPANTIVSEADVLLVVGSRLNPMDTNWLADGFIRPDEQTLIHADVDPRNAGWVYPASVGLIGDAAETLLALAEHDGGTNDWALDRAREARSAFTPTEYANDGDTVAPQHAAMAISEVIDSETIVTADSGNNRFWLLQYLQTAAPGTYFGSGGVGGMGWAPPAALSAALTTQNDVVCVTGDGGFAMTMTAVETAVEYDLSPTFVILNDTGLGMVRQMDEAIPGVTFPETDFVAIADAFGADGIRIESTATLKSTLGDAIERSSPVVVDIPIDPSVQMSDLLASSFYERVGGLHE
ncbi:thiamine pyrophosphate-binding protein [Halocatena halophila]|uniref:thiamine pyrophosphate-binding protein n=1 Tax=Halocatena halophila TaxID=2814576 RepID=UPI002ED490ED